jgi:hypothetical protein
MFEAQGYTYSIDDEIKILNSIQNAGGVSFTEIHIEGVPYYGVLTQVRDYEKQGLTTNIGGSIDITQKGIEYLNQLLNSKRGES